MPEGGVHQIVGGLNALEFEAVGDQFYPNFARNVFLRIGEKSFDVAHHRIEELGFVQHHAVPVAHLVFPILLPLGEGMLLQQVVCFDEDERCGGFKTHPAFDANDGIAYVDVAPNGVWPR